MQKRLITAAVAGALALPAIPLAAQADATWYGSVRNSLQYRDLGDSDDLGVHDHSSRLGVKGSNDLGNGLSVPYRIEMRFSTDDDAGPDQGRLGRVGLAGGFGAIHIGQLWGPYFNIVGGNIDYFNSIGASNYRGNYRESHAIRYDLPSASGIQAQVALIMADADDGEDLDKVNAAFGWSNDQFGFGVGAILPQIDDENGQTDDVVGARFTASFGSFTMNLGYEDSDLRGDHISAIFEFTAGPNTYIGQISRDNEIDDTEINLAWVHKLGKSSRVAVELSHLNFGDDDSTIGDAVDNLDNNNTLSLFLRTDF